MRYLALIAFLALSTFGCQVDTDSDPTQRQRKYFLHNAGYEPVRGEVVFTELAPGKIEVDINLKNTPEGYFFPAHLHFGAITEVGELALRLEDVDGATGRSITVLDRAKFSGNEIFTYDILNEMNGSVKIHMASDIFQHIVLAYGNVGINENYATDGVAVCTGH